MTSMEFPWTAWRHVLKLDPDRDIDNSLLRELGQVGTDAIVVGGTQGITYTKTRDLIRRIRILAPQVPIWQEISDAESIVTDVSGYAIPLVLNSSRPEWLIGRHVSAIEKYGSLIPWQLTFSEGYLILNEHAAVASLTHSVVPDTIDKAVSYAVAAEKILGVHTLYVEYSGIYGDVDWVREIRAHTTAHLIYGGGIDSPERAAEMAEIVNTVVIGNAVYEKGIEVVRQTVAAVRAVGEIYNKRGCLKK